MTVGPDALFSGKLSVFFLQASSGLKSTSDFSIPFTPMELPEGSVQVFNKNL